MGKSSNQIGVRKKGQKLFDLEVSSDPIQNEAKISITHYGEFIEIEDGYNLECFSVSYDEGSLVGAGKADYGSYQRFFINKHN